ncbi:MAG: type II toxin-antitoxin system HipA family toxin [Psychromonas sp.]
MAILDVYLNGYLVGKFTKDGSGAHHFAYSKEWLDISGARPISLSMPLSKQEYKGDVVYNYFDNLLPDNSEIRQRIVARYQASSTQPFDLLSMIGRDCVGAVQLLPQGIKPENIKALDYKLLSFQELSKIIKGYQSNMPLGMIEEEQDFRISVAGAQEKTALLNIKEQWCLPIKSTPTSHIIKLPIGEINSHSYKLDMHDSVENEFLCMLLVKAYGLPVAECEMIILEDIKALSVKRFDRQYSKDGQWLMRRPQEDYCQVFNTPSALKYENQGGPGIEAIMHHLIGSKNAEQDRYNFMKAQVLFWLLGASDGHAKNFSIFILPDGQYQLTPFYDILSIYPVVNKQGLNIRQVKLAMGLKASKGKKYHIDKIYPRHFLATAKLVGFDETLMLEIMQNIKNETVNIIDEARKRIGADFPKKISESIFSGMLKQLQKLP